MPKISPDIGSILLCEQAWELGKSENAGGEQVDFGGAQQCLGRTGIWCNAAGWFNEKSG